MNGNWRNRQGGVVPDGYSNEILDWRLVGLLQSCSRSNGHAVTDGRHFVCNRTDSQVSRAGNKLEDSPIISSKPAADGIVDQTPHSPRWRREWRGTCQGSDVAHGHGICKRFCGVADQPPAQHGPVRCRNAEQTLGRVIGC